MPDETRQSAAGYKYEWVRVLSCRILQKSLLRQRDNRITTRDKILPFITVDQMHLSSARQQDAILRLYNLAEGLP
jgi:hypothetical protein